MKKYLEILLSSILSGILIGIGAAIYLMVLPTSKIVGSLFFGFGLFAIIQFGLFLFTGKVGFVLDHKPNYLIDLLVGLIGNFIGIISFCLLMKLTRCQDTLVEQSRILVNLKQNDSWYSIFFLSVFCGMMIYLAVQGHKKTLYGIGKAIMCFLGVSIFILCGFEHCIANAAYYTYAGVMDWKVIGYFVLMILGNSVGSILLDGLFKLWLYFKNQQKEIE